MKKADPETTATTTETRVIMYHFGHSRSIESIVSKKEATLMVKSNALRMASALGSAMGVGVAILFHSVTAIHRLRIFGQIYGISIDMNARKAMPASIPNGLG